MKVLHTFQKKLNNDNKIVYSLHGDGELQEGQIWEAAMYASAKKIDNLISTIDFKPDFKDQLYFVHLNSKKNSEESVVSYKKKMKANAGDVLEISLLSKFIAEAKHLIDFEKALVEHEKIISKVLGVDRIKKQFFSDFPGEIKSLGAWGGDFVMATSTGSESDLRNYFKSKGKSTILRYEDMVL